MFNKTWKWNKSPNKPFPWPSRASNLHTITTANEISFLFLKNPITKLIPLHVNLLLITTEIVYLSQIKTWHKSNKRKYKTSKSTRNRIQQKPTSKYILKKAISAKVSGNCKIFPHQTIIIGRKWCSIQYIRGHCHANRLYYDMKPWKMVIHCL